MNNPFDEVKDIEQGWIFYESIAVPKEAGDVQRNEMKASFYAGCATTFSIIDHIASPEVSNEEGAVLYEKFLEDMKAYALSRIDQLDEKIDAVSETPAKE